MERITALSLGAVVVSMFASPALAQDEWTQEDERIQEERIQEQQIQEQQIQQQQAQQQQQRAQEQQVQDQQLRYDLAPSEGGMFGPERQALFTTGLGVDDLPETMAPGGVIVMVGGAVTDFSSQAVRRFTDVGGGWDVRLLFPSRHIVSGELAYVGSAQGINALGLDEDATLLSNGVEATLRLNILPGMLQPYVFGGIGWRYYNIVNAGFNESAIANSDHVGVLPMGGGLMLRLDRFIVDARGTFRVAFDDDMFNLGPGEAGNMHTWAAELRVGAEI